MSSRMTSVFQQKRSTVVERTLHEALARIKDRGILMWRTANAIALRDPGKYELVARKWFSLRHGVGLGGRSNDLVPQRRTPIA